MDVGVGANAQEQKVLTEDMTVSLRNYNGGGVVICTLVAMKWLVAQLYFVMLMLRIRKSPDDCIVCDDYCGYCY